jgi:hypothetical protein
MSPIIRRALPVVLALSVLPLLAAFAGGAPSSPTQSIHPPREALKSGEPIGLNVESAGVAWRGNTYHLVRLGTARFRLVDDTHLTATVQGAVTTFDNVDYTLHAAAFDRANRLLGTAQAPVHVDRIWLGKVLLEPRELKLDFGLSNAYRDLEYVTFTLSERDVLAPDRWLK